MAGSALACTRAYDEPSDEERERPEYWRYWRDLPPKGRIGLFLSSWYSRPVLARVYGEIDEAHFDDHLDQIVTFENALAEDGALILKFWMHLSRNAQKRRLRSLEKDPLTRARVKDTDWEHWKMYDAFVKAAERTIMKTSTGKAPWTVVEGVDHSYRSLTVGTIVRDAVRKHLEDERVKREIRSRRQLEIKRVTGSNAGSVTGDQTEKDAETKATAPITVLDALDMSKRLTKAEYQKQLKVYQAKLTLLHREALRNKVSTILVFEGPDAAGKGGAIRRVTAALDARNFQVISTAAPTDEERAQHYLWRFWRHLSRAGRMTIYDRSWYGRVLVERVEGFATEDEWQRAYAEINDFEEQLTDYGIVLLKYWIHITKEEQYTRFKAREETPHKRWKLTEEDWRNREKWDEYTLAVNDVVQHTSTLTAPWTLVEGNDKRYARVKVMKTLCKRLEMILEHSQEIAETG